jgi:hypothetical protein
MITSEVPLDQYGHGRIPASDAEVRTAIDSIAEIHAQDQNEPDHTVGRLTISWPNGPRRPAAVEVEFHDAQTGEPITGCVAFSLGGRRLDVHGRITADLTLLVDDDGQPLSPGAAPAFTDEYRQWIEQGQPIDEEPSPQVKTAVFRYLVEKMRMPAPSPGQCAWTGCRHTASQHADGTGPCTYDDPYGFDYGVACTCRGFNYNAPPAGRDDSMGVDA